MKPLLPCASAFLLALSAPVTADDVFIDDMIVQEDACFGPECVDGEFFPNFYQVKLKSFAPTLIFEDTDTGENDWRLQANSDNINGFYLRNENTLNTPFTILGNAPSNSLFVAADGRVGIGTSIPVTELHVKATDINAALRLEEGFAPVSQAYDVAVNVLGFGIFDVKAGVVPFYLGAGAPNSTLYATNTGNIGLGTGTPEGKLHVKGNGVQLSYLESGDGGPVQLRFRTNSENRRFLAVNNANEVKSQIVFGDNQIQFLGQTVAQEWLRISSAGIVSSGPTCNPNPVTPPSTPKLSPCPRLRNARPICGRTSTFRRSDPQNRGSPST